MTMSQEQSATVRGRLSGTQSVSASPPHSPPLGNKDRKISDASDGSTILPTSPGLPYPPSPAFPTSPGLSCQDAHISPLNPAFYPLAKVFRGTVIHSTSLTKLDILENAVLGVDTRGKVMFLEEGHPEEITSSLTLRCTGETVDVLVAEIVALPERSFIVPGFCDVHTHAPQFKFAGLGYDMQLLDWLENYTFPNEARWKDAEHAARVATNAVRRTLANGTTSACWFATIHTDAALLLADIAHHYGQRAFVGKVNMDRNSPDTYVETTSESLAETERFFSTLLARPDISQTPRPMPVITPRFVPTCTAELMKGLAVIANKHDLLIQSHVSENKGEIAWVKELHPKEENYTGVYDSMGLLNAKTILAHGVYLGADERKLMASKQSVVAHCPMSNLQLRSGMCDVRQLLEDGVPVALGTDVSGGASPSMLTAIREACKVSNMVSVTQSQGVPLSYSEAFYLATVGGAKALSTPGLTGDFSIGADFDAIVVDPSARGSPFDLYDDESVGEAFQKWLQLGDDRNTRSVFVRGAAAKLPEN